MVTKGGLIGVYIMTGAMHGTLYIGVTSDLIRRTGNTAPARAMASPRATA